MTPDVNMLHTILPNFVSFPFFRFTLVIQVRNSDFESHYNESLSYFFDQKI